MKKRISVSFLATLICCVLGVAASGKGSNPKTDGHCGKTFVVNAQSESRSGDKVRGPITVKVTHVNVLRYEAKLGSNVTFTAGPDLSGLFIPPGPKTDAKSNQAAVANIKGLSALTASANSIDEEFNKIVKDLDDREKDRLYLVQTPIVVATEALGTDWSKIQALLNSADAVLAPSGGQKALLEMIESLGVEKIETDLATKAWPFKEIAELLSALGVLRNRLEELKAMSGWPAWYGSGTNGAAYEYVKGRLVELQTQVKALDADSDIAKKFKDAQDKIRYWVGIISGVKRGGEQSFELTLPECCGFSFGDNKSTKVELVKRDRLAPAGTAPTKEEIVTVECTSPLSISGGFGFSSVEEKEFVFVPSKPPEGSQTPINTFGFKNRSSFRTIPLLLINTRVWEFSDTFAVHASAGAGVDVKTGQAGTDIEYIVGGSLSFKRSFFVTPGIYIGRVPSLAGGFNPGDTVPSGVSAPPVEKTWKRGVVIAFSYRIK